MWIEKDNKLKRELKFPDFKEAFRFMNQVADAAEAQGHHPWWSNVYNQVTVELTTHDAGNTITEKDRKLADTIDTILKDFDAN